MEERWGILDLAMNPDLDDIASEYAGTRRRGVGSRILDGLLESAGVASYRRVLLETTETWTDAIAFYERRGFREVGRRDREVHMTLDIEPAGSAEISERRDVR
jgi:GNAT superfamily N-acetyltransferase